MKNEKCNHEILHFEGKNIAWLVCTCGKRWERCVEYSKSIRSTFYRSKQSKNNKLIYSPDKKGVVDSNDNIVISKIEEANMI